MTDDSAHAHQRADDDTPRLHRRLTDGEVLDRLDETDEMMRHVLNTQMQIIHSMNEVREAVDRLADETVGIRELEGDVIGMMRLLTRVNRLLGLLWKPVLFVAVAGGMAYLWLKGKWP